MNSFSRSSVSNVGCFLLRSESGIEENERRSNLDGNFVRSGRQSVGPAFESRELLKREPAAEFRQKSQKSQKRKAIKGLLQAPYLALFSLHPRMFGNNTITSSWANPQQNQQQQQPPQQGTSAFGQPSAFGSTGVYSNFRAMFVV